MIQRLVRKPYASLHLHEGGQMMIVFALVIVPVSFLLAAIAIDASVWQSERRGAQKDADLASLAGAYELFDQSDGEGAAASAAKTAAADNADTNDEAGNAAIVGDVTVDHTCFNSAILDSVAVDVSHEAQTFFSSIFGLKIAPDIGAHARACMGSVISTHGLRPYGIESEPLCSGVSVAPPQEDLFVSSRPFANAKPPTHTLRPTDTPLATPTATNTPGGPTPTPSGGCRPPADSDCFEFDASLGHNVPKFGSWCQLDDGSADPSTSTRGLLDLGLNGEVCSDGGNDNIDENIQDGSNATCSIGDTVIRTTGARPGQDINNGIQVLLDGDGTPAVADGEECDKLPGIGNDDGIDDFDEVLERIDGGSEPSPDAVYQLRACVSPRVINLIVIGNFEQDPTIKAFAAFYILGCKMPGDDPNEVLPNDCSKGAPGQLQLWGIFFNKVELDGDIGEFNPFGTRKIALVE